MNDWPLTSWSALPRPIRGLALAFTLLPLMSVPHQTGAAAESFQTQIERDWTAQEKRLGQSPEQPEAIRAVLDRAGKLLADLQAINSRPAILTTPHEKYLPPHQKNDPS